MNRVIALYFVESKEHRSLIDKNCLNSTLSPALGIGSPVGPGIRDARVPNLAKRLTGLQFLLKHFPSAVWVRGRRVHACCSHKVRIGLPRWQPSWINRAADCRLRQFLTSWLDEGDGHNQDRCESRNPSLESKTTCARFGGDDNPDQQGHDAGSEQRRPEEEPS